MPAIWRVWQLADSAFPSGGFAHSGGLEAAAQLGEVTCADAVERFAVSALWQAGTVGLPLVRAAFRDPDAAAVLDARCEAALAGHVTRRASRTQGRAWLATCGHSFAGQPAIERLAETVRSRAAGGHLAVVLGASLRALEVGEAETLRLWLFLAARGVLSAAVRLGLIGPHEAQRMQDRLGSVADAVLAGCATRGVDELAHSAPIAEVLANLHDALPARMFQS
ncbi:MAG TPA: urease accessory UreF family protein [Kofleriaceae bacterium]|nr:urease accessory UreF family protein [Kofleriaceae bacterium]